MQSAVCFCRYENLHRKKTRRRLNSERVKARVLACRGQHLHSPLVWFEQLAGEFTEDGQVWQVWRCRCLRGLTKLLEHEIYPVPADHTHTEYTHSLKTKPRKNVQRGTDQWIRTTPSRNLTRSPKVRANLLASSLMPVNVWTPWQTPPPLSCSRFSRANSWGEEDSAGVRPRQRSAGVCCL